MFPNVDESLFHRIKLSTKFAKTIIRPILRADVILAVFKEIFALPFEVVVLSNDRRLLLGAGIPGGEEEVGLIVGPDIFNGWRRYGPDTLSRRWRFGSDPGRHGRKLRADLWNQQVVFDRIGKVINFHAGNSRVSFPVDTLDERNNDVHGVLNRFVTLIAFCAELRAEA